jgi:hypothetical protein
MAILFSGAYCPSSQKASFARSDEVQSDHVVSIEMKTTVNEALKYRLREGISKVSDLIQPYCKTL